MNSDPVLLQKAEQVRVFPSFSAIFNRKKAFFRAFKQEMKENPGRRQINKRRMRRIIPMVTVRAQLEWEGC